MQHSVYYLTIWSIRCVVTVPYLYPMCLPHSMHVLYCTLPCARWVALVLSCRAHRHRWWLKAPAESPALVLPPSTSMEQVEGLVEMEGEVEFRRDTPSNQTKAVSGTEWMYRSRALERGKLVGVFACMRACVRAGGHAYMCAYMCTSVHVCVCVLMYMCVHVWLLFMVLWQELITYQSPMSFHMCRLLVSTYGGIDSPATTSAGWQTMSRQRRRCPVSSGSYISLQRRSLWGRLRSTGQGWSDTDIWLQVKRYGLRSEWTGGMLVVVGFHYRQIYDVPFTYWNYVTIV